MSSPSSTAERKEVAEDVEDVDSPEELAAQEVESKPSRADGKIELTEHEAYDKLGFSFPTWKKWAILTVIFWVQMSMNFNTSVYPNLIKPLTEDRFHGEISEQGARVGQMIFLVAYAFGCELWAPWSEEIGRWPVLQLSLFLVNIFQIPCALAPNFNTIIAFRFLGGLSSAGGSVTLGMIADMFEMDDQQYAVGYIVLSSVGGTSIGPVIGGFIEQYLPWYWNFWIQLIFGAAVQFAHLFVPETRVTVMLDKEARKRRKAGETNIYGPNELKEKRFDTQELIKIWTRPFIMFVREPIVLCLSLLSGFSDALIFTFLESYVVVFKQWDFTPSQTGLAFIPYATFGSATHLAICVSLLMVVSVLLGYLFAWWSFFPFIHRDRKIRRKDPDALQPERRLYWLLYTAPLETIGLFGFAWTSLGPAYGVHWIAPMIFSFLVGVANYCIYMATVDYMIASYGPYSASATGGNGFSRDFLAGIAAMYSAPFYSNIGTTYMLEYPTTILACIAILVTIPIYIFYWKGPVIRERSKFAQTLASDRKAMHAKRKSTAPGGSVSEAGGGEKA